MIRKQRASGMRTDLPKRFLRAVKTTIALILNPHYLLCYGIAWLITNGWAYVFTVAGSMFDISWMLAVGSGYLALIWLPLTPEKLITLAIAILLLRRLFPNDQKTLAVLRRLQQSATEKWRNRRRGRRDNGSV